MSRFEVTATFKVIAPWGLLPICLLLLSNALGKEFGFAPPRETGMDTVESIRVDESGKR